MTLHHHTPSTSYQHAVWRVIALQVADGPTNMAIDQAIAEAVGQGIQPPTLRFYTWQPGCLSLGFAQPAADADPIRLRAHGWDIVRRLTGGRAILHIDELTYSIAVPEGDPRVAGGVVESYRRLSRGLMLGLQKLGAAVEAEQGTREAHGFKGPVCFEVPSDYEVTADGKKLLGSAQTRRFNAVLQHGALPLWGNITRICEVLAFEDEALREQARQRVAARAVTLEEALGQPITVQEAARSLQEGLAEALNLSFEPASLSSGEKKRAAELRATRYADAAWTGRL